MQKNAIVKKCRKVLAKKLKNAEKCYYKKMQKNAKKCKKVQQ